MENNIGMNGKRSLSDEIENVLKRTHNESSSLLAGKSELEALYARGPGFVADKTFLEEKLVGKYSITRSLGSGSSSKVKLGIDSESAEKVAVKIVSRKNVNPALARERPEKRDERIYREILISSLLSHPHIVRLIDFFYSETHFFLVFEYARGRQLFDIVLDNGPMDEQDARRIFRQILSGVDYIHKNSIVHRDLKIENILVDENGNAKIIDFGLSNFYDNKRLLTTFCGSLYFAAPELLLGQKYCGPEVDVWSLGVILYVMICGTVPFDDKDMHTLQSKIKSAKLTFPGFVSERAKKLISGMVFVEPAQRYDLERVMRDEWVNTDFDTAVDNYMSKRQPIYTIDEKMVSVLENISCMQFPDLRKDLQRFLDICMRENSTKEQVNWRVMPSVSLYYLLLENCRGEGDISVFFSHEASYRACIGTEGDSMLSTPERIHNFIQFMSTVSQETARYYSGDVFAKEKAVVLYPEEGKAAAVQERACNVNGYPHIRRSFIQGLFRGACCREIDDHVLLKNIVVECCVKNKITYDVTKKNYVCIAQHKRNNCKFKISPFYNIILGSFVLSFKHLSGDHELFTRIKELFINNLKNIKEE